MVPRLEVIDELEHRRLVGRRVEVADEVVLRAHEHRAGIDAERDRLAGALNRRRPRCESDTGRDPADRTAPTVIAFHADELNMTSAVVRETEDALGA